MSGRARVALLVCFVACAVFRFAVVREFSSSTPDGDQYLKLAASLKEGRGLSFDRAPTYARLPGFPLLLAAELPHDVTSREGKVHVVARWNVVFELVTVLLAFAFVRAATQSLLAGAFASIAIAFHPLLVLVSAMCLTETFATTIAFAAVVSACAAVRKESVPLALVAGALLGIGQLVRADSITAAVVALAIVASSRHARLVLALFGSAALVFAPWIVRNELVFHAPHPVATEWLAQDGAPLSTGPIAWMRTWSDATIGEQAYSDALVFAKRCGGPELIRPEMFDDGAERARLVALTEACRKEGLSPDVDAQFRALAHDRFVAHPWRTLVTLPLRRLGKLWWAPPAREIHWIKIPLLGLPGSYPAILVVLAVLYALAFVGLFSPHRRVVLVCVAVLATRSLLHAFAVPHYVGYRYFIEAWPIVAVLASLGVLVLARRRR